MLYIVDSAPPSEVDLVITHELVHALQDQYINLDSLQNRRGRQRPLVGRALAVIEGQAVFDQIVAVSGNRNFVAMDPRRLGCGPAERFGTTNRPCRRIARTPRWCCRRRLIFPYLSGAEFIRDFDSREPGKQPYGDMPTSTTQILHPLTRLFRQARLAATRRVTLPPPLSIAVHVRR